MDWLYFTSIGFANLDFVPCFYTNEFISYTPAIRHAIQYSSIFVFKPVNFLKWKNHFCFDHLLAIFPGKQKKQTQQLKTPCWAKKPFLPKGFSTITRFHPLWDQQPAKIHTELTLSMEIKPCSVLHLCSGGHQWHQFEYICQYGLLSSPYPCKMSSPKG